MLTTLNKKQLCAILCFSMLFMFCAHAFCYMNLSFSGPSVMVDVSRGNRILAADGQYLATLYFRVRGALSSPMIVGMISAACLTVSAILIADLWGLTHTLSLLALCGVLTLHISVTAINASMLHMADTYFLAFLFAAAAAWLCQRHALGFIPGTICLVACLGMQSSLFAAAPALILISCLLKALKEDDVRALLITLLKALLALAIGFAAYYVGAILFTWRQGDTLAASWVWESKGLLDAWTAPIRLLFAPTTSYATLCALLHGVLLAMSVLAVLVRLRGLNASAKALAAICMLLLPLAISLPVFASDDTFATSQRYALCLIPAAMVVLLDSLCAILSERPALYMRRFIAGAFGITFLSSIVFANQVYLKKNLEYQSTLSVMTRVLEQAEQTEGFEPGATPVAIIGTIEDSVISVPHKGFEHLAVLDAAANNFTASSQEENTWYFWEILGYPFNFVSDVERDAIAAAQIVIDMPAFPYSGYCRMLDGTLVIKLSDN